MWPMHFPHFIKRLRPRRSDVLRLESCPLHTERPAWERMAPMQVEAALKRGADVIGFTEVKSHLAAELAPLCHRYGYGFFHVGGDVAVAYKESLHARLTHTSVPGLPNPLIHVTFDFHGTTVTVIALHWLTAHPSHMPGRRAQTLALIREMAAASRGTDLAFYLADSNPDLPMTNPASLPRATLDHAGYPVIYETTGFPANIGVTTIGHARRDRTVKPVEVRTFAPLGSDHLPAVATFKVKRAS